MSDDAPKPARRRWLPTVIAIVVIAAILSVAVPASDRLTAREVAAVDGLRAIADVETLVKRGSKQYYVGDVYALHGQLKLLPSDVAEADATWGGTRRPRAGYWFVALAEPPADGFAFAAYPASHPHDGRLTFIIREDARVWAKDVGGSHPTRWPADPKTEGWRMIEEANTPR